MIWYRVGSGHEEPAATGTSHFLEHMMFKGTKRFGKGEIDRITTQLGGFNNAFTSLDYTTYFFSFASDRWFPALEIEADRMSNCLFDETEFELERAVVLEELRMELDNPWDFLRHKTTRAALRDHPYRFPVIGLSDRVSSLSLDTLRRHYKRFYSPNNAALVLVGNFNTGECIRRVEEIFGPAPALGGRPTVSVPEAGWPSGTRLELTHPIRVPRLMVALPAPPVELEEFYAYQLLDKLLGEGKLSRLYQRLIEKDRLASMVTTEITETRDPFLLFIRANVRESTQIEAAERAVREELDKLTNDLPSPDELERAKKQCLTHFLTELEVTSDQAFAIGLFETLDQPHFLREYEERIKGLNAEQVRETAQRYFSANYATVGTMRPVTREAS